MAGARSRSIAAIGSLTFWIGAVAAPAGADSPANPAIDMRGFLRDAQAAAAQRESHRLSEEEFLGMSRTPGTIVLDARSADKYAKLHVAGARSLPFTDITVDSLARTIPDRRTTILIYCNNNFANAPEAFPTKIPVASLNLSTYVTLWSYGYRNVYELGPFVDLAASKLSFEASVGSAGSEVP